MSKDGWRKHVSWTPKSMAYGLRAHGPPKTAWHCGRLLLWPYTPPSHAARAWQGGRRPGARATGSFNAPAMTKRASVTWRPWPIICKKKKKFNKTSNIVFESKKRHLFWTERVCWTHSATLGVWPCSVVLMSIQEFRGASGSLIHPCSVE